MNKHSEEFMEGFLFAEENIHLAIFKVRLEETKSRVLQGYNYYLQELDKQGPDKVDDRFYGGMLALHLFLTRHGVKHDWRFKD